MQGATFSLAYVPRALIALVCAAALTLGVVCLSQARGAKGTQHTGSTPILIMVQPATAQAPPGICPYAVLFTGEIAKEAALVCPHARIGVVSYTTSDDILPSSLTDDAPLRPPRTA